MNELKKYKPYLLHPYSKLLYGIIPCILSLFFFFSKNSKLEHVKQDALLLKKKSEQIKLAMEQDAHLLEKLKKAKRDYVQRELEGLVFLQTEINHLEEVLPSDQTNKTYIDRLEFLNCGKNSLRFREQNFKQIGKFQEVELIQTHPIEIDTKDLEAILHKLEDSEGAPYFIIKNIELIRKASPSNGEKYLLSLELIKYEMSYET